MSKKESPTYEVLATVSAGEKSVWKLQRTTFPDGATAMGLRRFIRKADGTEQVTTMGFSLKADEDFDTSVDTIIKLLKAAKTKVLNTDKVKAEEFILQHRCGEPYGYVNWSGNPMKGVPKIFDTFNGAKAFREERCPEQYQWSFLVKKAP